MAKLCDATKQCGGAPQQPSDEREREKEGKKQIEHFLRWPRIPPAGAVTLGRTKKSPKQEKFEIFCSNKAHRYQGLGNEWRRVR